MKKKEEAFDARLRRFNLLQDEWLALERHFGSANFTEEMWSRQVEIEDEQDGLDVGFDSTGAAIDLRSSSTVEVD